MISMHLNSNLNSNGLESHTLDGTKLAGLGDLLPSLKCRNFLAAGYRLRAIGDDDVVTSRG